MDILTIVLITLAALLALGFSFFQYLFRVKRRDRKQYVLFGFRSLSLFLLFLLLINPEFTTTSYYEEKPTLFILADNSASMAELDQEEDLRVLVEALQQHPGLRESFTITGRAFGQELKPLDSLRFQDPQTDISEALHQVKKVFRDDRMALVLLTDGNQTMGRDYRYFRGGERMRLLPVVVGDTAAYRDLEIERLNVNRYAYFNNRFPVETIVNYSGKKPVRTTFEIRKGQTVVYSEQLELGPDDPSQIVESLLPADDLGVQTYQASLSLLRDEKNPRNNTREFAVEILDQRSRILLLTGMAHPDLGALKKAVETNQQRTLEIQYIGRDEYDLKDYQLVILYQPDRKFAPVFSGLKETRAGILVVTGTRTDWDFLNDQDLPFSREITAQEQEVIPLLNQEFSRFQFDDPGFEAFPPLLDRFGPVELRGMDPLLFQRIEGTPTKEPLLAVTQPGEKKIGVLLGENFWRWRAQSYLSHTSFSAFDEFWGRLLQNLSGNRQGDRLTLDYQSFYYGNTPLQLKAQFFDENYRFDPEASLSIRMEEEETGSITQARFLLRGKGFFLELDRLPEGTYSFEVREERTGISARGKFSIIASEVESQFYRANLEKLTALAANNQDTLYFSQDPQELFSRLIEDESFRPLMKSQQKNLTLIAWYYLLFLLALLLAAEWFYRKYHGLI